jgi:prepilin-type N-terminal cleavage/methylation domain-containing protein
MRLARRQRGFTLIEVLIVVALIAVLAAAVVPKFSTSTKDATEAALEYNMKVLRARIQAYEAHHFGDFPTIQGNDLPQLTGTTNVYGEIGPAGDDYPYGPYIKESLPVNPFDQSRKVTAVPVAGQKPTASVGSLGGWLYDQSNGAVWPNHPEYYGVSMESAEAGALPP